MVPALWLCGVLAVSATLGSACASDDIGAPCPQLLDGNDAANVDGSRIETPEVVAQDVSFPCEEFICIASGGTSGYCSKKCRSNGGCPDGFECRLVQAVGPFANQKLCAWKPCETRSDCGSIRKSFCCAPVIDNNEETRLCSFSNDGKCPP
ncbi:MAG: hypothetical protein AAB426_14140 [Myxococcota bacterium]